jgi:hypothetical protein
MQINWCLKGIPQQVGFGDDEALAVLSRTGIPSRLLRDQAIAPAGVYNSVSQSALSLSALDDHVNHYAVGGVSSPYISLSAGCWEYHGKEAPAVQRSAVVTAMSFATHEGKATGYLFPCWVVTAPQIPHVEPVGPLGRSRITGWRL